ncbi:MAG: ABC transporter ATP-binding protein [Desulfobacula sp.]|jgi:branched-chain amino acid transport system ATP-binding protein|nr:ABC transporter ATP-binding protein [Desulfobacula sp.]MBT6338975.1 ABC transporter ATP-binding protein [Desulfobacula sp.]MBT7260649.1 ABC transporter ATP-binding protein [Desulfobacula sp.]
MNDTPIIETRDLTIRFGGHIAVNELNLKIETNKVKAIIGPNGAGKTTFFNLITGAYKASKGHVYLNGEDITALDPADRCKKGIGRSFQLTNIFPTLTCLENVRLAIQARENIGMDFWNHFHKYPELEDEAYEILKQVLMDSKWANEANALSHGEQRKLEIAMLLALGSDVLMLDEPTAGMSIEEVPAILDVIKEIKALGDKTIVLVEHKFDMIMAISDTIAVLQEGRLIANDVPDKVRNNEQVMAAYLGGGVKNNE